MLAVKSICLLPYLFKAFSRYSWIHFNLGSMHTCLLLLLSLALPKEKSQSESGAQIPQPTPTSPHTVPYFPWVPVLLLVNPWRCKLFLLSLTSLTYYKYPWLGNHLSPLTGSCGLYWESCESGTDTKFESKTSNSYLDLERELTVINRKISFGNTDMVNLGNFSR